MILVLASIINKEAAASIKEMDAAASLFTCYDLAVNRSALHYPFFSNSTITVGEKKISIKEITGAINILPAVFPGELFFYPEEEQEYQSAEFHALLTFFLSALECPVINRPSSMSLNGPFINPISWFHAADKTGIPLSKMEILNTTPPDPSAFQIQEDLISVIYIGEKIILPTNSIADEYTRRLAEENKCGYLKVFYKQEGDRFLFVKAQTIPDLMDERVCEGLRVILNGVHNRDSDYGRSEESLQVNDQPMIKGFFTTSQSAFAD